MVTLASLGAMNVPVPSNSVARTSINPASAQIGLTVTVKTEAEIGINTCPPLPSDWNSPSPLASSVASTLLMSFV